MSASNLFSCIIFNWLWYDSNQASLNGFGSVLSSFCLLEEFENEQHNFSLDFLEAIWSWTFVLGDFLIIYSVSLLVINLFTFSVLPDSALANIMFLGALFPFSSHLPLLLSFLTILFFEADITVNQSYISILSEQHCPIQFSL